MWEWGGWMEPDDEHQSFRAKTTDDKQKLNLKNLH
jgi:hypothetical protein